MRFPDSATEMVIAALGPRLLPCRRDQFITYLALIFAHTVEIELARCKALADLQPSTATKSAKTGRRHPKGLPVRLLLRLRAMRDRHIQLMAGGASPVEIAQFLKDLRADRELFWIVNLAMTESSGKHLALFWKEDHQGQLFEALSLAFQMGEDQLAGAIRRGATDPALEQMTRALAALYHDITGEPSGRTWQDMSDDHPEQGPFLALCRLMAEAVNQTLPAKYQRKTLPGMAKTVRRMVKELKLELRSPP